MREARVTIVPKTGSDADLRSEFDRQVDTLILRGYPKLAGLQEHVFLRQMSPLEERLPGLSASGEEGHIAFVIVVGSELVPPDKAMPLVELGGEAGFTTMEADDLEQFTSVKSVKRPDGPAYLVGDVDTGRGTLNVRPDEAIQTIARESRSPLTIDEGVALITHHPEVLKTRNCFSMLGSRCGDRRVTAMWISEGRPRLGWCWAGNRHTWLGSASCLSRA